MSSSKVARRKESSSVASAAEAFEQSLRGGGDEPNGFVQNNPKLASMLRLMSHLFATHDTKSVDASGGRNDEVTPEKIGRFIIKQKLGAGGFGTVYLADDEVLHRQVAVKVIRPVETDGNTRHWLEEARVLARLSHPNLVPLYEVVEDGALLGFVSEYCDGPTLAQWIHSHPGPIDVHAAASLVEKLADGVAYVHLKGLVHRDIKPSNVLLDVGNTQGDEPIIIPRLTDFGLAREAKHPDVETSPASWAGTLQYVAPEQFLRTEYVDGPGVDIYGLGVLLYRLLTGQLPHVEDEPVKLVTGICETPPPPLRSLRRDIPRDLEAICMRCLEKQPGQRYQSATELAEELRRFRDGSEVRARRRSGAEKLARISLAHPITSGLAGAIIVVSLAATGLMVQKNRTLHKQRQLLASSLDEVSRQNSVVEAGWLRDQRVTYHANIERAYAAFWNQNYSDSRTTLDATQDYLDRFPGGRLAYKLLDRMLSDRAISLPSHEGSIEEIVYVPQRDLFVAAGLEGVVRVHRASDGELWREFALGGDSSVRALAVSPDGNLIAVGKGAKPDLVGKVSNDVLFMSLDDRPTPPPLFDYPATIESLQFTPDGERLAVGARYEPLEIIDLNDGSPVTIASTRRSEDIAFSSDGSQVLLTPENGILRICDSRTGETMKEFDLGGKVHRFAWSPDNRWVAFTVWHESAVSILDVHQSDAATRQRRPVDVAAQTLAFSPDGNRLYAGLLSGDVVSWEQKGEVMKGGTVWSDEAKALGRLCDASVTALACGSNGQIVLGSATGSVSINKAYAPAPLTIASGRYATAATMDPISKAIHFGDDQGSLFCIDGVNQSPRKLSEGAGSLVTCVKLADDGVRLAIGWSDGAVGLLDLVTTTMVMKVPPPTPLIGTPSAVAQIEFSPDQKRMAAFLRPNYVLYFPLDVTSQGAISESSVLCPLTEGRCMMAFTDQRQLLLLGDNADRLDLSTLQTTRVADGADHLLAVCSDLKPGGIVTGSRDGRLRRHAVSGEIIETSARWEVDSAADVRIASITAVAFAPDGVHLLTGSDRGDIALWERDELRFVGELRIGDDRGPVTQIVLSADQECLMYHQLPLADQESAGASGVHLLDLSRKR